MFTIDCVNLPLERKEELKELALEIKMILNNYISVHPLCCKDIRYILDKSYSFFKKKYGDILNKDEKSVFYLYILIPDDDKLNDLIYYYNGDFTMIAKLFNCLPSIIKLRYLLQKNINAEKTCKENKILKK